MVHLYLKMAHRSARPDLQEIAPGPAPLIMVPFCSVREGQVQVQATSSQQWKQSHGTCMGLPQQLIWPTTGNHHDSTLLARPITARLYGRDHIW